MKAEDKCDAGTIFWSVTHLHPLLLTRPMTTRPKRSFKIVSAVSHYYHCLNLTLKLSFTFGLYQNVAAFLFQEKNVYLLEKGAKKYSFRLFLLRPWVRGKFAHFEPFCCLFFKGFFCGLTGHFCVLHLYHWRSKEGQQTKEIQWLASGASGERSWRSQQVSAGAGVLLHLPLQVLLHPPSSLLSLSTHY